MYVCGIAIISGPGAYVWYCVESLMFKYQVCMTFSQESKYIQYMCVHTCHTNYCTHILYKGGKELHTVPDNSGLVPTYVLYLL